jgi:uncharacterized membrane protein
MEKNDFKVYRTLEGTIFEVVTALLVVASLLITVLFSHFGDTLLGGVLGTVLLSVCALLFLFLAYHPASDLINIPVKRENPAQLEITVRMMRVVAVEIGALSLLMSLLMGDIINRDIVADGLPPFVIMAVLFVTISYYCWKIKRAQNV